MVLIIREYEDAKDREQTADVFAQVYRSGEPMPADEKVQGEDESVFVAELDGRIVGAFIVEHMQATLAGANAVRCGGIAGVAVRPDARQKGVAGAMMRWAIDRLRSDGYAMSHLYGFRESFYRRLGWEVCGRRLKITCPQHRLPRVESTLEVRELEGLQAWTEVEQTYNAFARQYSGMNLRTRSHWIQATRGTKRLARLYAAGDPAEAYCVVHVQTAFWEEQHISEFAWATPEGYRAMLTFFGNVASNKTAISWHEPSDSPFLSSYLDQGVQVAIVRPIMYRILDIPSALAGLAPAGEGALSLQVTDAEVPANSGAWHVEYGSGRATATPAREGEIEIDVRALSQALLGEPSFEMLLAHGSLRAPSGEEVEAARRLFTPRPTYCMDFF